MAEIRILKQPLAPWINPSCQILILGSFPSVQAVAKGFFYGNPHNRFYEVMGSLLNIDFKSMDKDEKRTQLLARHIAVYDIVESCQIAGSSDASMTEVVTADITRLILGTTIKHIFLNGQTAWQYFTKSHPYLLNKAHLLPSTSPANARWPLAELTAAWRSLLDYLSK